MTVTCLSQRDPRWSGDRLGTGTPSIGQVGCLITSIASLLADFGTPTDPHALNLWLTANGGYSKGNLFVFDSLRPLGARLVRHVNCVTTPAPVAELVAALTAGQAVVVEVDHTPGGPLNQHWVRLVTLQAAGGWIMDPWQFSGAEMTSISHYLKYGWDTAKGIFAAAIYKAGG